MDSSPIASPTKAATQTPSRTPSRTPNRRALSAEPYSGRASVHTPLDRSGTRDLRASIRRGTPASAGRSNAPTPHAKAARRALDQRRTAIFTPGKNRRRSLMRQRETPLDVLRTLGKVLAPTSKPIASSSSSSPGDKTSLSPELPGERNMYDDDDDDDDDLLVRRPRLSLPLRDEDSSSTSSDLRPPRLSQQWDEDNYTAHSEIEMPLRATSEQAPSRMSRGSFGSIRMSDFPQNDLTEDIEGQTDFFSGLLDDLGGRVDREDPFFGEINADDPGRMTLGRDSGFNLDIPLGMENETTVMLSDPAADVPQTSPIMEHSTAEGMAEDALTNALDVAGYSDSDVGGPDIGMGGFDFDDGGVDDHSSIHEEQPTMTAPVHRAQAEERLPRGLKARKKKRISQHGIEYPALPPAFVKRVAQTALQSSGISSQRLSAETLDSLIQASEWFFEQLGDDLGAYADHAKRKTIEESDVFTLMKRQRQIGPRSSMFSLAQRHLPRELLQELRMPVPQPAKQRRAKRVRGEDGDEGEVAEYT
ncbi:hypothetical protein FZEAL_4400 [Fusarium zealandicum]|uniref:CENP-T/Histone H4 histone fold domain-containing protein n=1 Tax=Fusarium zealandicum TaxID=1053134 RepID=A0A8H4XKU1_9HYPO|nr:hypothetical protein FZEAL_4400 [Fusarium zealandicum]